MIVATPKSGMRGVYIGPSESQAAAVAAARPPARPARQVARYSELHDALAWFRDVWQASLVTVVALHEGYSHPGDDHNLGGPAWHHRFLRFLAEPGVDEYDPVRRALAHLRFRGNLAERTGAVYLFVVACRDFDLRSAGLAMAGHCVCPRVHLPECACDDPERGRHQHGACPEPSMPLFEEYASWFAERAIARLRWVIENPPAARPSQRPEWMDRIGFGATPQGAPSG